MIFTLIKVLFFVCIGVGIDIVGGEGFLGDCGVLFFVLMMFLFARRLKGFVVVMFVGELDLFVLVCL